MKNTGNQLLEQQEFLPFLTRRTLIGGIGIVTVLFALLLADIFYVQYPLVTHLGFAANIFLLLPLLGLLLGTGGVLGRIYTSQKTPLSARWNAALVAPLICMGFLLIIFIAETICNLW